MDYNVYSACEMNRLDWIGSNGNFQKVDQKNVPFSYFNTFDRNSSGTLQSSEIYKI